MAIVIGASVRFLELIVFRNCTGLKFADKGEEAEIEQLPVCDPIEPGPAPWRQIRSKGGFH
jgi:hypothetical protein